jgi:hypothetical protein
MFKNSCLRIIAALLVGAIALIPNAQAQKKNHTIKSNMQVVKRLEPARADFFNKCLDCMGIPIMSSDEVNDSALLVANRKIRMMLAKIPNARQNMVEWETEIHIIGKNQQTSDLPEFRHMKGVKYVDNVGVTTDIDARTRGMGGIYTSFGEENLLNLPGDRYAGGQDICIHEFAHDIMDFGLDSTLHKAIKLRYNRAVKAGLWKGAYAAVNESEYWAELSMWYFGKHGEYLKNTKFPVAGPQGLKDYDSGGYALLDSIYSGKFQIASTHVSWAKKIQTGETSIPGVEKATFMIINRTPKPLKLFWVGFDGKLVSYNDIGAHNVDFKDTFTGHTWELENQDGKSLGYFSINALNCKIEIN